MLNETHVVWASAFITVLKSNTFSFSLVTLIVTLPTGNNAKVLGNLYRPGIIGFQ